MENIKNITIESAIKKILAADAIVVGVGSGMSSAAGYNHYHNDDNFQAHFHDYYERYGIKSMMDGFCHVFSDMDEHCG